MARKDFPVAIRFEQQDRRLAHGAPDKVFGVKCWYCDASLIENGADRAFIGINPGGQKGDDIYDNKMGYLEAPYEENSFNAWLDEEWPKGNPHQKATRKLFQEMYGEERWEQVLRSTACFNTCPLRTSSAKDLPDSLWNSSTEWVIEVMNQVRPQLIICNGSGKFRSPWSVITGHYGVDLVFDEEVQANGYLREGRLKLAPLTDVRVLGLPFLNRFGGHNLFSMIQEIAEERPFL